MHCGTLAVNHDWQSEIAALNHSFNASCRDSMATVYCNRSFSLNLISNCKELEATIEMIRLSPGMDGCCLVPVFWQEDFPGLVTNFLLQGLRDSLLIIGNI